MTPSWLSLIATIALINFQTASGFSVSVASRLISHSKVWTPTVLRALSDDDDDDDDDPFASLLKERDNRRAAIRGKAAELMNILDPEKEEEEAQEDDQKPAPTVEDAVVSEIADAIKSVEDEEILHLVEVSLSDEQDDETEDDYEDYIDEEDDIYEVDDDENYPDEPITTKELFDKLFELADADSSGGIDSDEFTQLYGLLSILGGSSGDTEVDSAKAEAIFASMDEDGSGTVELEELKQYLISEKVEEEWPELYDEISAWN